ncbi:hypothetical protein PV325_000585 [Microctonus aethiopoides]|nr:hypothetical protein PV325_000585 [Microctonus aethiopoides]
MYKWNTMCDDDDDDDDDDNDDKLGVACTFYWLVYGGLMERCFYVSPSLMTFSYYVHDNGYYGAAMLPVSET